MKVETMMITRFHAPVTAAIFDSFCRIADYVNSPRYPAGPTALFEEVGFDYTLAGMLFVSEQFSRTVSEVVDWAKVSPYGKVFTYEYLEYTTDADPAVCHTLSAFLIRELTTEEWLECLTNYNMVSLDRALELVKRWALERGLPVKEVTARLYEVTLGAVPENTMTFKAASLEDAVLKVRDQRGLVITKKTVKASADA